MQDRSFNITIALLLCVAAAIGGALMLQRRDAAPAQIPLMLRFHPLVGNEPLVLNEPRYDNPGGSGHFAVRDFQFFLSNIRLRSEAGDYVEPDSYHLVRFDGPEPVFEIVIPGGVPPRRYTTLEFGIGVDPAANSSIEQRGDLDPNGRMAWTWDVGYKFILFEGRLDGDMIGAATATPLVYHVGYDENYRTVSASLANVEFEGAIALDFNVDALRLFQGDNTIDMQTLSTVKFDHADAARIARNYANMITPAWTRAEPQASH